MSVLRAVRLFLQSVVGADPQKVGAVLGREPQVRTALRKARYQRRVKGLFPTRRRSRLGATHYRPHCGCQPAWFSSKAQFLAHSPERCIARQRETARG